MRSEPLQSQQSNADRARDAFSRYQTSQSLEDFQTYQNASMDARIDERFGGGNGNGGFQPQQQQYQPPAQQQADPNLLVQQAVAQQMYERTPGAIPVAELAMELQNSPMTPAEFATVVQMRRAGGQDKFADGLRSEGRNKFLETAGIKVDGNQKIIGQLPTVQPGVHRSSDTKHPAPVDINQMADQAVLDHFDKAQEAYNKTQ